MKKKLTPPASESEITICYDCMQPPPQCDHDLCLPSADSGRPKGHPNADRRDLTRCRRCAEARS
jgi:hypothetical protein